MGASRLVAVPYAMYSREALNAQNADVANSLSEGYWQLQDGNMYYNDGKVGIGTNVPASKLEIRGDETTIEDDLLFSVVNNSGDTVFAVFQGGVRIYVDDNPEGKATGNKGDFA